MAQAWCSWLAKSLRSKEKVRKLISNVVSSKAFARFCMRHSRKSNDSSRCVVPCSVDVRALSAGGISCTAIAAKEKSDAEDIHRSMLLSCWLKADPGLVNRMNNVDSANAYWPKY